MSAETTFFTCYRQAVLNTGVADGHFSKEAAALATDEDIHEFAERLNRLMMEHKGGIKGSAPGIAMTALGEKLEARLLENNQMSRSIALTRRLLHSASDDDPVGDILT